MRPTLFLCALCSTVVVVGLLGSATPTQAGTTILATGNAGSAVIFSDDFDGSSLDSTRWNTDVATSGKRFCPDTSDESPGSWIDISADPCHGVTVSPPYGSIAVGNGLASFTAPFGQTFPYIWAGAPSRPSPFPSLGDFALDLRMRYDTTGNSGNGVVVADWANNNPDGTDNPWISKVLQIWADSYLRVNLLGTNINLPGSLAIHDYRLEKAFGAYSLFVDGSLVIGPIASALRPNAIWVGHPDAVWWVPPHSWAAFTLDSIRVSEFTQPMITLTKSLVPASDSGRFDLKVGSRVVKASAGNGDSGSIQVRSGSYTVTESAASGSPSNYGTAISCTLNGGPGPSANGTSKLHVTVELGDVLDCTLTNRRKATITLTKHLLPLSDPGRFDLKVARTVVKASAGEGASGSDQVAAGTYTVSEVAASGTSLSDYASSIDCTLNGNPGPSGSGTSLQVAVKAGDVLACTLTNQRN